MKLNILKLLSMSALVCGCSYDFPEPDPATLPSKGSADFTTYVAVGNSLTAGYMNGALYEEGQRNSFSKILADQFKPFNDNAPFNIPILTTTKGGWGGFADAGKTIPYGRLFLKLNANCAKSSPSPKPTVPGDALTPFEGDKSTLNNFGVPGVKLIEAVNVPNYGTLNPFYGRFAVDGKTLVQQAAERNSTFFTMWLGSNDVVAYALAGGTGSENGAQPSDMSPASAFNASFTAALTAMLGSNSKGVVANIPDVTSLPHFTTINPNIPTFPLDATSAAGLNMLYAGYGYSTVDGNPLFKAGTNNFVISVGADADKKVRQFDKTKDFFVLTVPTDSLGTGALVDACGKTYGKRAGWGVAKFSGATPSAPNPISDRWLLDETEVAAIKARTLEFNNSIKSAVDAANSGGVRVGLVDINKILVDLNAAGAAGILVEGLSLNSSIAPPYGGFSLDGVHPNPRGHAFMANHFIDAINKSFNANISKVNPNNFKGNELPSL